MVGPIEATTGKGKSRAGCGGGVADELALRFAGWLGRNGIGAAGGVDGRGDSTGEG